MPRPEVHSTVDVAVSHTKKFKEGEQLKLFLVIELKIGCDHVDHFKLFVYILSVFVFYMVTNSALVRHFRTTENTFI